MVKKEFQSTSEKLRKVEVDLEDLTSKCQQNETGAAEAKILRREVNLLTDKVQNFEEEKKILIGFREELKEKAKIEEDLKGQLIEVKGKFMAAEETISGLKLEVEELKISKEKAQRETNFFKERLKEVKQNSEEKGAKISENGSQDEILILREAVEKAEKEVETLRVEMSQKDGKIADLSRDLEDEREKKEKEKSVEIKNEEVSSQEENLRKELEEIKVQAENLNSQIQILEKERNKEKEGRLAGEKEIEEFKVKVEQMKGEIKGLQENLSEGSFLNLAYFCQFLLSLNVIYFLKAERKSEELDSNLKRLQKRAKQRIQEVTKVSSDLLNSKIYFSFLFLQYVSSPLFSLLLVLL